MNNLSVVCVFFIIGGKFSECIASSATVDQKASAYVVLLGLTNFPPEEMRGLYSYNLNSRMYCLTLKCLLI
jgi:hypothetical protein